MSDPFRGLDPEERNALEKASFPRWVDPMLATLTDDVFSDENWIFERKLDGVRCLVFASEQGVCLRSRNRQDLNATYPELKEALEEQAAEGYVADGEVVAFEGKITSFSRLQERMQIQDPDRARASSVAVYLYLFDLLHLAGRDLSKLPLRRRKVLLRGLLQWNRRIRFTAHRNTEGRTYFEEACRKGWEGLIAKDASSPYVHSRSRSWLKFKCTARQEFVIGGFTDPEGTRTGFGALLLGYYEDGDLRYAGKVGTGFDEDMLERLGSKLQRLERKTPPYDEEVKGGPGVHWVSPRLVGEVGFTEWTETGKLRHPRFLGLRHDKDARDVRRERPS